MARNVTKMVTPVGVAVFPHLSEPDYEYKKEFGEYHVKLVLPGDDPWVQELQTKLEDARSERYDAELDELKTKNPKAKEATLRKKLDVGPIGITEEEDDETQEPTGNVVLKFSMAGHYRNKKTGKVIKMKPKIFDAKKNEIKAPLDMWSGSKIRVQFYPQPYNSPAVGVGVSLKLMAVQIIELAQGGGAGGDMFDEEDGYEFSEDDATESQEDTPAPAGPDDDPGDPEDF